ncbi:uncharacterized protein [Asterias amurensis]|uniref:uncharacterized protein n=1 Tax=Asterias amurensis TaxID=7602 RepID=UPI003AB1570A
MASNMWKGLPELHVAIRRGQFHDARQLVSAGDDVNCGDGTHRTPLILCALLEQATWGVGIARMLLEMGALVGLPDKQGRNALIYACIYRRLELVEIFLRAVDFDLNHRDRFGNTALFYAASSGNIDIVTELVKKFKHFGEKLDRGNKCGMTPLLEACRLGHKTVGRILVENGADEEHRDSVRHWNAMDWEQEHERQVEAADRTRNRSYDKPWLADKKSASNSVPGKPRRRSASLSGVPDDGQQGLSDDGDSTSTVSTDGGSTPHRARCVGLRRLTRAKTMSALPNINSAKVVGLTRTWTEESNMSKELITAKFYPSPVPFSNPSLTTDAEKTHNAYGQWRMTQNLRPVESSVSSGGEPHDRAAWQGEFRQIFKRYEHQVTESFRKKAKVNPVFSNQFRLQSQFSVNPSIAIEEDRKAPSSRLSRRQSFLDNGQLLKRFPSVNSIDTASNTSRRTNVNIGGLKGKRDMESNTSSVDTNAAAKMVMNAFRRRKSNAFVGSSSTIGKGSVDDDTES